MEVQYNKQAKKYLAKLPKIIIKRIIDAINHLPEGDVVKMQGASSNRLRVGGFRVLFDVEQDVIYIRKIASRGQIYKK